jgi:F-type H+-transporting ATPase subunit a
MVTIKKSLHLLTAAFFALLPLASNAETVQDTTVHVEATAVAHDAAHEAHAEGHAEQTNEEFVNGFIQHHLMDDHYYSFFADKEEHRHYGFALPII